MQPELKKVKQGVSYGRVSTDDQYLNKDGTRKEDASPEVQKSRCRGYMEQVSISSKGAKYQIREHFSDDGYSGKNTKRPRFEELERLIKAREIDFVVATELSRLSRDVRDFLEFIDLCNKNDVEVFIIGIRLDTASPFGRVVLTILVALAQFEREVTGERIRENALTRLLEEGKINGTVEILGLDRDSKRPGHFLTNFDELKKVEKIMKLFLEMSSKTKVLAAAKRFGFTGKGGRELTGHMVSNILENARLRYRGIWFANEEKKYLDQSTLSEREKHQAVALPHGPLLDIGLLDQVDAKLKDTYDKKKRSGKDDFIYFLTNLLVYEDGSKFGGQPGKDRQYRYYYNRDRKIRIRCDELDPIVTKRIKSYVKDHSLYNKLVTDAIKRKQENLPELESELQLLQKDLSRIGALNEDLSKQFLEKRSNVGFMDWLENQVNGLNAKKQTTLNRIQEVQAAIQHAKDAAGFNDMQKVLRDFAEGFDELSPVQKRDYAEKIIKRIVIKSGNKLDIEIYGQPPLGVRRKKSTDRGEIGRRDWI